QNPINQQQIDTFNTVLEQLREQVSPLIAASLCNSAGIINFPQCHYDWVRPGIMLYGSSPMMSVPAAALNLQPVMTLSAALMAVHDLPSGAHVGYGSLYTASMPIKKGIVSIGYGDGYPRAVSNSAWVSVYQDNLYYRCPILGRVAMDMIAIDVSAIPNPRLGSPVILWGDAAIPSPAVTPHADIPSVDEVAEWANTIGYELLCRLTTRPSRQLR
ncbi:MAG: alanine racemase, partial [Psychrobacter sp.]|nr:alanine racemase [Psychrobacter sp.]